jgi:solute carrier family 13 (sodium-dependent dicarboxylate transporter), member 2/3/5
MVKKISLFVGLLLFTLIIIITGGQSTFWNAIALGFLMIFFWLFEIVPIYVTALFPIIFSIPLGILTRDQLASAYGDKFVYLFLGGFILALALEKWHVHIQISKKIISFIGQSKPRIILGFMLTTGLLSMWISNTATTLMMLPMVIAVIDVIPNKEKKSKFPLFLLLSVAYAASIGGMGTLVGSPTNTAMASSLQKNFGTSIDFIGWFKIGFPVAIIVLIAAYFFFYLLLGKERKEMIHGFDLEKERWNSNQFKVILVFLLVVVLWSFKGFILPHLNFKYTDEGVAILGALLLFFIPSDRKSKPLLEWPDMKKLPWGVLLLFGGGTALATMLKVNGVVDFISQSFISYNNLPYLMILILLVALSIFGTEVMSNFALVTAFIPVIAQFALDAGYPILQMCLPVTLAASCAFMLPVGTPPNAIVFSSGLIHIKQMAKYGIVMNLISLVLIVSLVMLFLK